MRFLGLTLLIGVLAGCSSNKDTLASLNCTAGQVARFEASGWTCATVSSGTDTLASLSCSDGQVPQRSGTSWSCVTPAAGTDTLAALSCSDGQVAQLNGTTWGCGTIAAGMDTLASLSCMSGQMARWSGTAWECDAPAVSGDGVAVAPNGTVSINAPTCGAFESARWTGSSWVCELPARTATATCTASLAGAIRFDAPTKTLEFCDGSAWQPLSVGRYKTLEFEPVADATVNGSTPRGTQNTLVVNQGGGDTVRSFLRFDISSLPVGAVVRSVELKVTPTGPAGAYAYGGDGSVYVRGVGDDTWGETTITATNQPQAAATDLAFWWLWSNGSSFAGYWSTTSDSLREFVQGQLGDSGNKLVSLRLHSTGYYTTYHSREATNAADRPKLVVTYY